MAVYTRSGDDGSTSVPGGERVPKDAPRLAALGSLDELNAHIGLALGACGKGQIRDHLQQIQRELFVVGAVLAGAKAPSGQTIGPEQVRLLEERIDQTERQLPTISGFVLPGGTELAARWHVARTVCRRAERAVVTLGRSDDVPAEILAYLNRLGDLLFTYARWANHVSGGADVL